MSDQDYTTGPAEVCRNFRNNGRCRFGDDCKFEHSTGDPIALPARGLCFNFRDDGECQFGDRCRFFHGTEEQSEAAAVQRRQDIADGKIAPKKKRRAKKAPELNADGVEICRGFKNSGSCRFGDDCKWSHEGYVAGSADAEGQEGGSRPRRRRKKKTNNVCFTFQDEGECQYGDECRFQHGDDDTRDLTRTPGPCFNFRDEGECQYGDDCRFSHIAAAPADDY